MNEHLLLILGACLLDALLGDPVYRLHPIRLIGHWSLFCERVLFARGLNGRLGGVIHWGLVVGAGLGGWFGVHLGLGAIHPWLALGWDLFIAYSLLCTRELLEQGWRILRDLDDLPAVRRRLSLLVGRDTEPLQRDGVVRATLESLSENLTDGVLTPLWAFCLFGLPGLILVKAISTLDSMVGYQNERYARFGWAGARSDDLIHWLPARLSVPLLALAAALLREHPRLAFRAAWRYHALLPSPNSGWSEAACAGALRVRLIGPVWRQGQLINERYMGDPDWPADLGGEDLRRGLRLILVASLLALWIGLAPLVFSL
ncbi:adenosylcobinamide-phosphate synthase CbiB [Allochromatium palmeri]|uniref:Cobalamin biosynthesis protein CobD n=1 Tax=Allochromatium palmeri TaxID=231048 RepID=A0A6N8ECJ5_9GAMM|nr:adenosylcobinamide-phosphate synthase CbiB [Allochromatium palmeri]MTW21220.1 cobalamin biosynthesis protein CobD [Allochromatium palmeri]